MLLFLFRLGDLLAVLAGNALLHIKLALALQGLRFLHSLRWQHTQLDTLRSVEAEQVVCNLGRVCLVVLVACTPLIVLHHRSRKHGVAEFLASKELLQGIRVVPSELQSEERVLRVHVLLLCPSEQFFKALLLIPHLNVGKPVNHFACDKNRGVQRLF